MAQEFKLDIFKRNELTKSEVRGLRMGNNIPGIFYSYNSKQSTPFYINSDTLNKAKKSGARIFNIKVGDKKQNVIFKSVQYHPVTDQIIHIDLYGVNMEKAVTVKVQLILTGTATGVTNEGGVLVQSLNEIEIDCLPGDIPENIEVDIAHLNLGDSYRVEDLDLDKKYDLKTDEGQVIASVTQAMKEEETLPDLEEDIEGEEVDEDSESTGSENTDAGESQDQEDKKEDKKE
tara:strand:- start:45 stop:740 length:696 start_codon:yes stop_codon:yes gene_type:complete